MAKRGSKIPELGLANAAPSEADDHSLGLGLLVVSGPFCQLLSPSWGPLLDRDVAGTAASSAPCLGAPKSRLPDTSGPAELVGTTGLCLPTCLATCTQNTTTSVPHQPAGLTNALTQLGQKRQESVMRTT